MRFFGGILLPPDSPLDDERVGLGIKSKSRDVQIPEGIQAQSSGKEQKESHEPLVACSEGKETGYHQEYKCGRKHEGCGP